MKGQASHVLSEGEKSIIAFAYYLGDIFVKVTITSIVMKIIRFLLKQEPLFLKVQILKKYGFQLCLRFKYYNSRFGILYTNIKVCKNHFTDS